jgi:hypothetical protein
MLRQLRLGKGVFDLRGRDAHGPRDGPGDGPGTAPGAVSGKVRDSRLAWERGHLARAMVDQPFIRGRGARGSRTVPGAAPGRRGITRVAGGRLTRATALLSGRGRL